MSLNENKKAFDQLARRFGQEFGEDAAREIIRILVEEAGGVRMTFPTEKDLSKCQRNENIRNAFNGRNYEELALRWGLTIRYVRRIING